MEQKTVYDVVELIKKDKTLLDKMNKRPWAGTVRKFNEVFKEHKYSLRFSKSRYSLYYEEKPICKLPTVQQFFKLLNGKYFV